MKEIGMFYGVLSASFLFLLPIGVAAQTVSIDPNSQSESQTVAYAGLFEKSVAGTEPQYFSAASVLPAIRHVDQLGGSGTSSIPLSVPFAGDLVITYVIDYPDHRAAMTKDIVALAGLETPALHQLAMDNLMARSHSTVISGSEEGLYFLAMDGVNENALLLDHQLWADVVDQIGPVAVAVPAPNRVFFAALSNNEALGVLVDVRDDGFDTPAYDLSDQLFTWSEGTWQVLKGQTQ